MKKGPPKGQDPTFYSLGVAHTHKDDSKDQNKPKIILKLDLTPRVIKIETLYLQNVDQDATILDPKSSSHPTLLQEVPYSSMNTKKLEIPPKAQKPLKWGYIGSMSL